MHTDKSERRPGPIKNVVLVHGGFVDGAGWQGVFNLLTKRGYNVSVVQNPTSSLAADLAATRQILDTQEGDVVLVGHSCGGVVITEVAGESVSSLIANPPSGAPGPRSCRHRTASSSSIRPSSWPPSRPMSSLPRPRSWPSRRCPGGAKLCRGR